jgi:hypothetical protein
MVYSEGEKCLDFKAHELYTLELSFFFGDHCMCGWMVINVSFINL